MILDYKQLYQRLLARNRTHRDHYLAMYSSLFDGIVTDPLLMMLPIDDHMVHRGDGVFEMFKSVNRGIYNLQAHLERLALSAKTIDLTFPFSMERLQQVILETLHVANRANAAIRVYLSRGTGSFSVNPYDCPESHVYVVVTTLPPSFMETHPEGASVISSSVPAKPSRFATLKHCNYLPNVLMKKEAIDAGADFAAGFDAQGYLTEGPTENIIVVNQKRELLRPYPDSILEGTTMNRILQLAAPLLSEGIVTAIRCANITREDMLRARELLLTGTSTDVTFAATFDGQPYPKERPVFNFLQRQLTEEIYHSETYRTLVP